MASFVDTFGGAASAFKDAITHWFLNPMQSLLAESPWWLSGLAITALAFVFGGVRALVTTVLCLAGIWYLDLWHDAMITLNMALVGTVLVMVLALVFGVWMARDRRVDLGIRPLLDAGQTIPPFVYLIPVLALFGPVPVHRDRRRHRLRRAGRHQAGRRRRSRASRRPRSRPAASTGQTTVAGDHQGPAADGQGLAGAGHQPGPALRARRWSSSAASSEPGRSGYDVVLGISRSEEWGKGAAAGITIVLLGMMLDRITRAAADVRRDDGPGPRRAFHIRLPIGPPG